MTAKAQLSLITLSGGAAASLIVLSLIFTNPAQIGPVGVTIWFLILFLALAGAFSLLLYAAKQKSGRFNQVQNEKLVGSSWRQGLLLSGWITGLLAMSSLRQLTLRDGLMLGGLLGLLEIFLRARQ